MNNLTCEIKKAHSYLISDGKSVFKSFIKCVLGIFYGLFFVCVIIRDFFYSNKALKIYRAGKPVISVGNISWGGAGKTSLVMLLHRALSSCFNVASITKGYARDEFLLLREELSDVFDAKDRVGLIQKISGGFDLFILDDGFQYRKLARDLDIVLIRGDNIGKGFFSFLFREPFSSLRRADILIVNYCRKENLTARQTKLLEGLSAEVFFADYEFKSFLTPEKKETPFSYFTGKKVGLLTGVGYPEGVSSKIEDMGITLVEKVFLPDHYELSGEELNSMEKKFLKKGIKDVIITYKDLYHFALGNAGLNYFVFSVALKIEDEDRFLNTVKNVLSDKVNP